MCMSRVFRTGFVAALAASAGCAPAWHTGGEPTPLAHHIISAEAVGDANGLVKAVER